MRPKASADAFGVQMPNQLPEQVTAPGGAHQADSKSDLRRSIATR